MEFKIYDYLHDDAKYIRQTVFVDEQKFTLEFDDEDNVSVHFVCYDKNKPIATARIYNKNSQYHLGRLAVLKEYRGKNIGKLMIDFVQKYLLSIDGKSLCLSAQVRVQPFYEKCGYTPVGEQYLDEYCPHIKMIKNIG